MLQDSEIHVYLPATHVARARVFDEQKLGFTPADDFEFKSLKSGLSSNLQCRSAIQAAI